MRTLFVVTSKELPPKGFVQMSAPEVDDYLMTSSLLEEGKTVSDYLSHSEDFPREVKEMKSVPILKRVCGEYHIYYSLCLDDSISGFGDAESQQYVGTIVDIAKQDMRFDENSDRLCIIVHDKDLIDVTREGLLPEEMVLVRALQNSGYIYVYLHESGFRMYNSFVKRLSESDEDIANICAKTIEYLDKLKRQNIWIN